MKIKITKADLQNTGAYLDIHNCLICTAIRRHFKLEPEVNVSAGPRTVEFQDKTFYFDEDDIFEAYSLNGRGPISPATKPFELELNTGA